MKNIFLAILLLFLGWKGYTAYQERTLVNGQGEELSEHTASDQEAPPSPQSSFTCDGRTRCSQMTSCAEATFFIQNCSGTEMDGDRDGVPCEKQWCNR